MNVVQTTFNLDDPAIQSTTLDVVLTVDTPVPEKQNFAVSPGPTGILTPLPPPTP